MMTGMDDRDDPDCELTLEAMAGLSKILAVVDESNVRHIFINICLRIRPCFVKVHFLWSSSIDNSKKGVRLFFKVMKVKILKYN